MSCNSITFPRTTGSAFSDWFPPLDCALKGQLSLPGGDRFGFQHWHPQVLLPNGSSPGSHNHPVAEAAMAALVSRGLYAKVRPWWRQYLKLPMMTAEARSGIYAYLILVSVGAYLEAARKWGDSTGEALARAWLDSWWAFCSLAAIGANGNGKRVTLHFPGNRVEKRGAMDSAYSCALRGQRSYSRDQDTGITSWPVNLGLARALTGQGGFPQSAPVRKSIYPAASPRSLLRDLADGDGSKFAEVVAMCPQQMDGCQIVRFERGVLCVTSSKVNGNTAPLAAVAIHRSGETDIVSVFDGSRPAPGAMSAVYEESRRRVAASGPLGVVTLNLPIDRWGHRVYQVDFPRRKPPKIVYPRDAPTPPPPGEPTLPAPTLLSPAEGAVVEPGAVELRCAPVAGATAYEWSVTLTGSVAGLTRTEEPRLVRAFEEGVYWWTARAFGLNAAGPKALARGLTVRAGAMPPEERSWLRRLWDATFGRIF